MRNTRNLSTFLLSLLAAMIAWPTMAGAEVPDDVANWYEDKAVDIVMKNIEGAVILDTDERVWDYTEVTVGEPRQLFLWTDEFRSGVVGAAIGEPIDQWVAPLFDKGRPVGSIQAYRNDSGTVGLAYFDDFASFGKGLAESSQSGVIFYDPPLSAYFDFDGSTFEPLSDTARAEMPRPLGVDEFQQQLTARYQREAAEYADAQKEGHASDLVGGGASVPTEPGFNWLGWPTWLLAATVIAAASGAALIKTRASRKGAA